MKSKIVRYCERRMHHLPKPPTVPLSEIAVSVVANGGPATTAAYVKAFIEKRNYKK